MGRFEHGLSEVERWFIIQVVDPWQLYVSLTLSASHDTGFCSQRGPEKVYLGTQFRDYSKSCELMLLMSSAVIEDIIPCGVLWFHFNWPAKRLIVTHAEVVNAKGYRDRTPLYAACKAGQVDVSP